MVWHLRTHQHRRVIRHTRRDMRAHPADLEPPLRIGAEQALTRKLHSRLLWPRLNISVGMASLTTERMGWTFCRRRYIDYLDMSYFRMCISEGGRRSRLDFAIDFRRSDHFRCMYYIIVPLSVQLARHLVCRCKASSSGHGDPQERCV
jgi:hypothetical protein